MGLFIDSFISGYTSVYLFEEYIEHKDEWYKLYDDPNSPEFKLRKLEEVDETLFDQYD